MKEIDRKSDVIAIGDLGGKALIFKNALKKNNLINESGDWIGGNTKIVLQGDILGDSGSTSFEVFEMINKLNKQAEKYGGEILALAGNHDRLFIDFLNSGNIDDIFEESRGKHYIKYTGRNGGLNELNQFLGDGDLDILNELEIIINDENLNIEQKKLQISQKRQELLINMRNSEYGKMVLEGISKTKIMEQVDDNLYIHVAPHDELLDFIINNSINNPDGKKTIGEMLDRVNTLWQKHLRIELLGEENNLSFEEQEEIIKIKEIFLSENGTYSVSEDIEKYKLLNDDGINIIQHGHVGREKITYIDENLYGDGNGDKIILYIKSNDDGSSKNKDHKIPKGQGYQGLESSTNINGKQIQLETLSSIKNKKNGKQI